MKERSISRFTITLLDIMLWRRILKVWNHTWHLFHWLADLFTNPLGSCEFNSFGNKHGMYDIHVPIWGGVKNNVSGVLWKNCLRVFYVKVQIILNRIHKMRSSDLFDSQNLTSSITKIEGSCFTIVILIHFDLSFFFWTKVGALVWYYLIRTLSTSIKRIRT